MLKTYKMKKAKNKKRKFRRYINGKKVVVEAKDLIEANKLFKKNSSK